MVGVEAKQGPPSSSAPLLKTSGLSKDFRGFRAVDGVDLTIKPGTIQALVGPNGAGKTTLFNLLTGFLAPSSGSIMYRGQDITGKAPERIAHLGIARSFQITSLFDQLTGLEHLELALASPTGLGLKFWRSEGQMGQFSARSLELIDEVCQAHLAGQVAGRLAYAQNSAIALPLSLSLCRAGALLAARHGGGVRVDGRARATSGGGNGRDSGMCSVMVPWFWRFARRRVAGGSPPRRPRRGRPPRKRPCQ